MEEQKDDNKLNEDEKEEKNNEENEKKSNETEEDEHEKKVRKFFGEIFGVDEDDEDIEIIYKKGSKTEDDDEIDEQLKKRLNRLKNQRKNSGYRLRTSYILLTFLMIFLMIYFVGNKNGILGNNKQEVTYTQFVNKIRQGEIQKIIESGSKINGISKKQGNTTIYSTNMTTSRIGDDSNIMQLVNEKNIDVNVEGLPLSTTIFKIFVSSIPLLLMIFFYIYISKKMTGGGGGGVNPFNIGRTKNKISERPKVTFEDVAGLKEEKEELREIVEFLKNPKKFKKAGARVPKGVLLLGAPGTGKTLLAKAVAGESGAAFFAISGSEFVELYVGVGASRVRDLFKEAKKEKSAIIFIDEIDAVGRRRDQNKSGSNDEREQTLNQLLVEMDGFDTDERIIVIAATNRADILDPALLRGGRFDRRVEVSSPDVEGRVEILKVHSKNKKLAEDVKLIDIAKITPGFVGADLENLLNEAAILATRRNSEVISMEDLDEAVDKIGMGLGQRSKIISPRDKKMLAYHEGGHALISSLLEHASKVHKVTIIPRGDAGGYMMPLPEETLGQTRAQLLAAICVCFGGRAAEELMMDDIATGAYSDIKKATDLAKLLITKVGMSKLGPVNYEANEDGYILTKDLSDETSREIDLEIRKLLTEKYEETLTLLKDNKDKLEKIANLLIEKETVTGSQIRAIVKGLEVEEVINMSNEELEKYY